MAPARIHRVAWQPLAQKAGLIGGKASMPAEFGPPVHQGRVKAMRDGEAVVRGASCDDVLGMVAETLTIETLAVKLEHPVPELLWLTGRIE